MNDYNEKRRAFLLKALKTGVFSLSMQHQFAHGFFFSNTPDALPKGKSFYKIEGIVKVNGIKASVKTIIKADDKIETGADSKAVFVVGKDAFLLREKSKLQLNSAKKLANIKKETGLVKVSPEDNFLVESLRLFTGAVLTVFGKSRHRLTTPNASIGIRGTGVYVEAEPERSYICTCYGLVDIASSINPDEKETVETTHHESPRYVYNQAIEGSFIKQAMVKNHNDDELIMLEALVDRLPPFYGNHFYDSY